METCSIVAPTSKLPHILERRKYVLYWVENQLFIFNQGSRLYSAMDIHPSQTQDVS